jgi:hypothetical protein
MPGRRRARERSVKSVAVVLVAALMVINFATGLFNARLALSALHHWQLANIVYLCFAGVVLAGIALWRWTGDDLK